jgi:hypothetical protein
MTMSYHIRDVLRSAQEAAPAPCTTTDDIIARARRTRSRRNAAAVAGSVAACLAVTVTAISTMGAASGDGQAAGQPVNPASAPASAAVSARPDAPQLPVKAVDFATDLGDYRAGAYRVGPAGQVTAGYQEIPAYRDGDVWEADGTHYPLSAGTVTVYRPGVYNPASFAFLGDTTLTIGERYPVKVNGRTAIGIDLTYISPTDRTTQYVRAALAWQYADGAWATFVPRYGTSALPRADAAKIAAGLTRGKSRELRAPYRLGFRPSGWQAVGAVQTGATISTEVSVVFLHKGAVADPATRVDEVLPGNVKIEVMKGKPKNASIDGKNGVRCHPGRAACTIIRGDYLVDISSFGNPLPDADIQRIAQGLAFTDIADQATWVPVNDW